MAQMIFFSEKKKNIAKLNYYKYIKHITTKARVSL